MAFIHLSSDKEAEPHFVRYHLDDYPRISDPQLVLYRAFGLEKLRVLDFLRPIFLWRAFQTSILKKHGGGGSRSREEFQLPGAFLLHKNEIIRSYFYKQPWEHPDFEALARLNTF